jgi:hypothetical protein
MRPCFCEGSHLDRELTHGCVGLLQSVGEPAHGGVRLEAGRADVVHAGDARRARERAAPLWAGFLSPDP